MAGTFFAVDLSFVPVVVLPAVVGGFVETQINQRSRSAVVRRIYMGIMVALLALSCFNCARGLVLVG